MREVYDIARMDYLHIYGHNGDFNIENCFVEAGETDPSPQGPIWVDMFWTGNNRVQYLADGVWQPETPVEKNMTFSFPNHPEGVYVDRVRIL